MRISVSSPEYKPLPGPRSRASKKKAGPRRDPPSHTAHLAAVLAAVVRQVVLPNDPAGQKTTGHKQCTRAKRDQRSATRARERATGRRCSRSATTGGRAATAAATAATAALGGRGAGALLGLRGAVVIAAYVDGAVLERRSRAEARQHLLLIDAQALGSASNRTSALTLLVLGVHGSLDLITRVLQDRNVPAGRRLGER